MTMGAIAILVTIATTAVFTLLGVFYVSQQRLNLEEYTTSRDAFGTPAAIGTIVSAALGAWILFSPPEAGFAFGGVMAIVGYGLASALAMVVYGGVGPRLRRLMPQGHSLTEYALHRYGKAMYWLTEGVMLFYMFVYLAAELTAVAKALNVVADVPLGWTALIVITAVFIYTVYGGLQATIFTDIIQFLVIVPLLLVCFGVVITTLGGVTAAFAPVAVQAPMVLSLANTNGLKFGLTLIVAIVAAEIFNQSNWQRVYACKSDRVTRQSFVGSAFLIFPAIVIAGLLGVLAVQFFPSAQAIDTSTIFFQLLAQLQAPFWVLLMVIVLVVALVMSTIAALLNGIASLLTLDLVRFWPQKPLDQVLKLSRILTVAIGIPAIVIAAQGYSVLYIFLLADLVCAGVVFPLLYGLYSRRTSPANAFWSAIAGVAIGALFFPKPDFSPWLPLPGAGDLLVSFGVALGVSTVMALLWNLIVTQLGSVKLFDFARLQEEVKEYG